MGDTVGVKNFAAGPKWLEGYVTNQNGPVSFEVTLIDGRVVRRHIDHLNSKRMCDEKPEDTRDFQW